MRKALASLASPYLRVCRHPPRSKGGITRHSYLCEIYTSLSSFSVPQPAHLLSFLTSSSGGSVVESPGTAGLAGAANTNFFAHIAHPEAYRAFLSRLRLHVGFGYPRLTSTGSVTACMPVTSRYPRLRLVGLCNGIYCQYDKQEWLKTHLVSCAMSGFPVCRCLELPETALRARCDASTCVARTCTSLTCLHSQRFRNPKLR